MWNENKWTRKQYPWQKYDEKFQAPMSIKIVTVCQLAVNIIKGCWCNQRSWVMLVLCMSSLALRLGSRHIVIHRTTSQKKKKEEKTCLSVLFFVFYHQEMDTGRVFPCRTRRLEGQVTSRPSVCTFDQKQMEFSSCWYVSGPWSLRWCGSQLLDLVCDDAH